MWSCICNLAGRFCLLYFIFIMIYVGPRRSFHYVWLAAGIALYGAVWCIETGTWFLIPWWIRTGAVACLGAGALLFLIMEALVFSKVTVVPKTPVKYIIILGACVRGTRVTRSLSYRLKKAAAYAGTHPDCMLVVSGGQGPGEDITEAQAMCGYLEKLGIERERILLEDKSVNTRENLLFSKKVICHYEESVSDCGAAKKQDDDCTEESLVIAVCSNNFHMYRAMALARAVGKWKVEGLAAMTDPFMFLSFTVREGVALAKEIIFRHI